MKMCNVKKQIKICRNILQDIQSNHIEAKHQITLNEENKNLILYILGGRSITLCYTTLYLLKTCRFAEYGAIIRLIEETNSLANFFYNIDEKDLSIKKWFGNGIISPRKLRKNEGNNFKRIVGYRNKEFEETSKALYGGISEYIHPTYGISKMNLNVYTKVFDYEWREIGHYDIKIFVSISQSIISVINMIRFCKEFYNIDNIKDSYLEGKITILDSLDI